MFTSNLSVAAAIGCMQQIGSYTSADLSTLSITKSQYNLVHGSKPWARDHRRSVVQTLDALIYGAADVMGLQKITLPAEYVAAVIATFVAPVNLHVACHWVAEHKASGAAAADLAQLNQKSQRVDPVSAMQLIGLVTLLNAEDAATIAHQMFTERLGGRVQDAANEEAA